MTNEGHLRGEAFARYGLPRWPGLGRACRVLSCLLACVISLLGDPARASHPDSQAHFQTVAAGLPGGVQAAHPVRLPDPPASLSLRAAGTAWLGPEKGPPDPGWETSAVTLLDLHARRQIDLEPGQALWVHAVLQGAPAGSLWFLRVPSPNVDRVTVYQSRDGQRWNRSDAGDQVLLSQQEYRTLVPLFSLPADMGSPGAAPVHLLVRVIHAGSFSTPIEVVDQDTVFYQRFTAALWFGAYFGLAALLVMLAVLRGVLLRNAALVAFAGFLGVVALSMAAHIGVAGLYFWPTLPAWNHWSKFVLLGVAGGAFLAALAGSLSLSNLQPRFSRGMLLAGALVCAFSFNLPWLEWPGPQMGINGIFAFVAGCTAAALLVAWRRGDPMALTLALAAGISLVGAFITWAYTLGHWFTQPVAWYALPASLTLTVTVWYYGLSAHVHRMNESRIREGALKMQDPLTGLPNSRALEHKIIRMVTRCDEFRHGAAFVVIKVINGPAIAQEHGRAIIEETLVKVAASLRQLLRPVDLAARMGSFTYACAIEGPTHDEQLRTLATRIVAAGLALKADLPEQVCPDLAVWVLHTPQDGRTLGELYATARERFETRDPASAKRIFA